MSTQPAPFPACGIRDGALAAMLGRMEQAFIAFDAELSALEADPVARAGLSGRVRSVGASPALARSLVEAHLAELRAA